MTVLGLASQLDRAMRRRQIFGLTLRRRRGNARTRGSHALNLEVDLVLGNTRQVRNQTERRGALRRTLGDSVGIERLDLFACGDPNTSLEAEARRGERDQTKEKRFDRAAENPLSGAAQPALPLGRLVHEVGFGFEPNQKTPHIANCKGIESVSFAHRY